MRRREVIAGLGAIAVWPRAAGAQQKTIPLIGILRMPPAALDLFIRPFRTFMMGLGWEEGRTVAYRISYADGDVALMPELAKALVSSGTDVLVAAGTSSIRVLQNATTTIPIVGLGEDFVGAGFAKSMARPGGNVTGVSILATELDAKRLEVLRAALPTARHIALISDPGNPISAERWHLIEKAAQALDVRLEVFEAVRKRSCIALSTCSCVPEPTRLTCSRRRSSILSVIKSWLRLLKRDCRRSINGRRQRDRVDYWHMARLFRKPTDA